MKRDFLETLGLEKDVIDQIMAEHGKGVESNKTKIAELTEQLGLKDKEGAEAQKLIAELKKTNSGNEELQGKIGAYEKQVEELQKQMEALKVDNAVKVELLAAKAKAGDLDYLMFKIKADNPELSVDENGKLKGLDIDTLKTAYPGNFETITKKEVDVNELPKVDENKTTITQEQFNKMGYNEKSKLFKEDPDTYKELAGK